jgi:DNA transposition AAA+ family ATPase
MPTAENPPQPPIMTTDDSASDTTTAAPPAQDIAIESTAEQASRALVNQGDTVRASWPFSLDNIRANISHVSPEAKELLLWSFQWCIDSAHPLRLDEFAERVGYAANTLYKIYSGKYLHPDSRQRMDVPAKLVQSIRAFRRLEQSRVKLGRRKFVVTPTAKRVFLACDLARESQTPVFIHGASHIGKTEAFKVYCQENNHGRTRLIELDAVSGLHGLIRVTAGALGISPNANTADLTERIKRAVSRDMVLIFDEIHLLANTYRRGAFLACVEWIRRLYDFTDCGLVLSFTELGFEKTAKDRKRELEQVFRRGVHCVALGEQPTAKDVQMVLGAWGLLMPARNETLTVRMGRADVTETPYAMLEQLAKESGLKAIVERLRYASKFAADADEALEWIHVVRAHLVILANATKPEGGWQS